MSANTETTGGPPKGYVKCLKKCGRYAGVGSWCWECRAKERPIGDDEREVTMLQYPDWTPTIAAPAAHVERRKGQRWKFRNQHAALFDATIVERKGLGWKVTDVVDHDGGGKSRAFSDVFWEEPNYYTITLLADAPPEPAECWCGGPLTGETLCSTHAAEAAKCESPPAQEAPKAAPVCGYGGGGAHAGQVLRRHFVVSVNPKRIETKSVCDHHYLVGEKAYRGERHYAGPERLPKPQLAADRVEDCLPESDR